MSSLPASRWRRAVESPAAPLALLGIFAVLIVFTIRRFSIWIDESATLDLVVPNDYGEIMSRTAVDVHPPLWYWVLKPWLQLFGPSVVAARAQSAVFMLAAMGVWYHLVKTRFSRPLALLALALMVTNPFLLHYAVEGRMYAFGLWLVAVSCVLLTSAWRGRWIAYWLCAVALLYTHYFLGFVIAAQFVYLILRRREQQRTLLWIALYAASILLAFAPWFPNATHGTARVVQHGFWIPPVSLGTVPDYVLGTFLHRLDHELESARLFPALLYLAVWAAMLIRAARARGGPYALLWCLAGIPWIFLFALSCKPLVPVFHARYVIFGLPALITLLAAGALTLAGRWRAIAITVLVLGHLSGIQMMRWKGYHATRGYWAMKSIARVISKPIDGIPPVIVSAGMFPFFDAHASLGDTQRVLYLRQSIPTKNTFPEVLIYDHPNWYVLTLAHVHARHVWLLEDIDKPPLDVPPGWTLNETHTRGYARMRLFTLAPG